MQKFLQKLLEFREKRDWLKFHTPQNIAQLIVLEAGDAYILLFHIQYSNTNE